MQNQLNCNQVTTLLTFYIENRLDANLCRCVHEHLNNCPSCMEKYKKLRRILENFSEIKSKITSEEEDTEQYNDSRYQLFKDNLSAYIDNELSDSENIKIKKIAISNPLARKELEDYYAYKQLLNSSFLRTKNEFKQDYSGKIIKEMTSGKKQFVISPFLRLAGLFAALIVFMVIGLVNMLYF